MITRSQQGVREPALLDDMSGIAHECGGLRHCRSPGRLLPYPKHDSSPSNRRPDRKGPLAATRCTLLQSAGEVQESEVFPSTGSCRQKSRARCRQCGHGFLIAFSSKGRGVCPSSVVRRPVTGGKVGSTAPSAVGSRCRQSAHGQLVVGARADALRTGRGSAQCRQQATVDPHDRIPNTHWTRVLESIRTTRQMPMIRDDLREVAIVTETE